MNYVIAFKTIKQYTGTMEFATSDEFDAERSVMRMDKSIVSFMAFKPCGELVENRTNEFAVPIEKHCPCEKSHIGTVKSNFYVLWW